MSKKSKIITLSIIALIIILQLVPIDRKNPPVESQVSWDSQTTKDLFYRACADCHSHETKWPWYSYIAPISYVVAYDVNAGRKHFNISLNGEDERDEAASEVKRGTMPMPIYLPMHPEAKLTDTEKSQLIEGLKKTFGEKNEKEVENRNKYN